MTLAAMRAFIRARTAPRAVPLVPELSVYQATELTPLWHATSAELESSDPAPFWAFAWAGGQALARHILDHPELVRGRSVLDLGTGSGLVAIAAARAGARSVVGCDLDPFCEAALQLNAELNGADASFLLADGCAEGLNRFEVVLAGDLFYERALAERTVSQFAQLAARGIRALAGDPGRIYSPTSGVVEIASYVVPTSREIENGSSLPTRVLEVLPCWTSGSPRRPPGTSSVPS